jgi:hypothetical protein
VHAVGTSIGVDKTIVDIGEPWSAGSVNLCKKPGVGEVILKAITPVSVRGEVRLDGIGVRTVHYAPPDRPGNPDKNPVGTAPGFPAGLEPPDGFQVTTTCTGEDPLIGEIVTTLTKTGVQGGSLDDLRVVYIWDGETHEVRFGFHFGLCGTGPFAVPCS